MLNNIIYIERTWCISTQPLHHKAQNHKTTQTWAGHGHMRKKNECDRGLHRIWGPNGTNMRWTKSVSTFNSTLFKLSNRHRLPNEENIDKSKCFILCVIRLVVFDEQLTPTVFVKQTSGQFKEFIYLKYYIAILSSWDGSAIIAFIWYFVTHLTS